ncbi:MAG: tRNA (adenosine(37)-N6)-dimethylallyltransferase MiaA, partial [Chthoniobacterales bacterium]
MEDESLAPGFFVVGPTATGKSEIAAEVARNCDGEVVSADAFQIYKGLDLLTAKPEQKILARVPHHLIGTVPLSEGMNAERFRKLALASVKEIRARRKMAFIVGGSGMYVKALTEGLSPLPSANPQLRARLEHFSEGELLVRLCRLDAESARAIDSHNKRRLIRAVEICLLSGRPASTQRNRTAASSVCGVFVFRDRDDLYARINGRVERMFAEGVVGEVRAAGKIGATAEQTLGLKNIRNLIAGRISEKECIAAIQQATRRYAKRQLTWFRRQTNFEPLNLSRHDSAEAIEWITRKARLSFAQQ